MAAEHKTLHEALCAVQAEVGTLPKDATNPHFKSRFTPLDTIVENVGPVLAKHGLTWATFPCFGPNGEPALRYKLTHAGSGESESDTMPLLAQKPDPQGQGSAITYARRYSMTAVLNLVADVDDDGNAASRRQDARAGHNGRAETVSPDDLQEITAAAKGLKTGQIRLALGAIGVPSTEPFDVQALKLVPKAKVIELVQALAAMERA